LRDRLADIAAFDVDAALRNVGNRVDLLERVLRRFVERYRNGEAAFLQPAAADRFDAWLVACHSLRGACSSIGASILPSSLEAFERALHSADDGTVLASAARQLNDELVELARRLALALDA
jgi:HPt (histidine-containing phosphotransfer) domain-containing protein